MRCQAETRDGSQCEREATEGEYCWEHQPDARQALQEKKNTFIEAFMTKAMTVEEAAAEANVSRQTIYEWRESDLGFAERFERAQKRQDDLRGKALADSAFQQCLSGEASAALMIYCLKRWGGMKWKRADRKDLKVDDARKDPAMQDLKKRTQEQLEDIEEAADGETRGSEADMSEEAGNE